MGNEGPQAISWTALAGSAESHITQSAAAGQLMKLFLEYPSPVLNVGFAVDNAYNDLEGQTFTAWKSIQLVLSRLVASLSWDQKKNLSGCVSLVLADLVKRSC